MSYHAVTISRLVTQGTPTATSLLFELPGTRKQALDAFSQYAEQRGEMNMRSGGEQCGTCLIEDAVLVVETPFGSVTLPNGDVVGGQFVAYHNGQPVGIFNIPANAPALKFVQMSPIPNGSEIPAIYPAPNEFGANNPDRFNVTGKRGASLASFDFYEQDELEIRSLQVGTGSVTMSIPFKFVQIYNQKNSDSISQ